MDQINTNTDHPEFYNVCRSCGQKVLHNMKPVFSFIRFRVHKNERMQIFKISELLMTCSSITVEQNDELPSEICESCLSTLKKSYIFKVQSEKSDKIFRNHLLSKNKRKLKEKTVPEQMNDVVVVKMEDFGETDSDEMEVEYLDDDLLSGQEQDEMVKVLDERNEEMSEKNSNKNERENLEMSVNNCNDNEDAFDNVEKSLHNLFKHIIDEESANKNALLCSNIEEMVNENKSLEKPVKKVVDISQNENGKLLILCDVCCDEFNTNEELSEHNKLEHADNQGDCTCTISNCSKRYFTPNLLTLHIAREHNNLSEYVCVYPNCEEKLSSVEDFLNHNDFHIIGCKGKIQCDICDKIFLNEEDLRLHRETHEDKFQCSVCAKVFSSEDSLKLHANKHEVEYTYLCPLCGKAFLSKSELNSHNKVHSQDRNNACDICHKRFKCRSGLKSHYKIHEDEGPFLCPKCGKLFNYRCNLESHLLRHGGVKEYKCFVCKKELYSRFQLKSHLQKHTSELPFFCEICEERFRTKNGLKIHVQIHEISKFYECKLCNKFFPYSSGLLVHLREHDVPDITEFVEENI